MTPALKNASPAWRFIRASLIALVAAAIIAVAVKTASRKVRDMTPTELRAEMDAGTVPLDKAIETLQRMDAEERREVMQSPEARKFYLKLTPADGNRLILSTLDRNIAQTMERYQKMNKAERAAFIEEGLQRQKENRDRILKMSPEEREKERAMLSDANFEEIFTKALKSYLSATTSEQRAELAPLYEGALQNVQLIRAKP